MAQLDPFKSYARSPVDPLTDGYSVTPSDNDDLLTIPRAITCLSQGTVRLTLMDGGTVDLLLAAGQIYPIRATRIHATGTSATGIVALW